MRELSSLKNPVVQSARTLQTARGRAEQSSFLLDGEHMVAEALSACPERVSALFVDADKLDGYAALLARAKAQTAVYSVPEHVLAAISQVKTPQGIAAVCGLPAPSAPEMLGNRLMLLENVQDPGNVGTILRTLDAAGFDGCILTPGCADAYAPKTLRATMGSVFRVPVLQTNDLPGTLEAMKREGYAVAATELGGQDFYACCPRGKAILVIGSEGQGISKPVRDAATHHLALPMRGGAESLNAAVAAGIMIYEMAREQA